MSSEEVRQKIEREARRRLEEHLDELRLEFERMRLESHRKWEEFLMRLDFPVPELIPPGSIPEPAAPAPAAANLSQMREIVRAIDAAGNQVDALKAFLSGCVTRSDRAVLLVSRGDALAVWKAEGFSPSDDALLRAVSVSPATHPALAAAMGGTPITVSSGSPVSALLYAADAREGLFCPIVVREKISALLYADQRQASSIFDPEAIALLCFIVGAAVDRMVTRKISPAPALKAIESFASPAAAPGMEFAPEPEAAPEPEMATEPETATEPEPPAAIEVEEEAEAAEPKPEPPPAPAPPTRGIDFDTTGRPYRPPSGLVGPAGPRILRGPLAAVEEDPHEHAKKIARLLVSDIRLYNEAAIEQGKRHNNIYARLRDDIDRARQTYNERVPESVRSSTNYFHEELVRSLADGSPDAMGF